MESSVRLFKLFIACPTDIQSEIQHIKEVVEEYNKSEGSRRSHRIEVLHWQSDLQPEVGENAQTLTNRQLLEDADIVVALFWSTIGTPHTNNESYTVAEIREAEQLGKSVMVYFSECAIPQNLLEKDRFDEVQRFKEAYTQSGIYISYSNLADFEKRFRMNLGNTIHQLIQREIQESLPTKVKAQGPSTITNYLPVADIEQKIKPQFKVYWARIFGMIEPGEVMLPNGMRVSKANKNREEKETLKKLIEEWEQRIRDYTKDLQEDFEELDEFEEDEFKNSVFVTALWTVEGALKKTWDRELDRYRSAYAQEDASRILDTARLIALRAAEYAQEVPEAVRQKRIKTPEDLQFDAVCREDTLINSVIGYGIRSEILHKLQPAWFSLMTRRSLWGMFYLTDEADEFVVQDRDRKKGLERTSHNWSYDYARFTYFNFLIYEMLEDHCNRYKIKLNSELRYGYVNEFLVAIFQQHRQQVNKLYKYSKHEF